MPCLGGIVGAALLFTVSLVTLCAARSGEAGFPPAGRAQINFRQETAQPQAAFQTKLERRYGAASISFIIATTFLTAFGAKPLTSTNSGTFEPSGLRSEQ